MSDIQRLANPYDFANPVAAGELFIGRKEELSEIQYYLSQALQARRPINIALIGNRASGKTSLLNITEEEAKKMGLLTVRIDLDEGDAASQWAFFFKIFDSLLSSACEAGAYGGKHGKTFDTYVDMTSSLSIPEDKTFCPFLFPIQYAKALGGNNSQGQVPDYGFKLDLQAIQTEIKRTAVILFDEGNVLSKSRVHLQKLRNIFMNSRGYMLVLTGTPEMFPVMDDVFSPIIRQFRKINLGQFADQSDTEDLIRKYLSNAGIDPETLFDFEGSDLEDIHDLTGGRPYEIQLVCHTLFRRVQQNRAQTMSLDLGVIDEVRQQLESSQKFVDRPILGKIRSLDAASLNALATVAPCVEKATFDQIYALERIFATEEHKLEQLRSKFLYLKQENILGENAEGIVQFRGDDFDRIYTKYFSAEKEVIVQFSEFPYGLYARIRLDSLLRAAAPIRTVLPIQFFERLIDIDSVINDMSNREGPSKVYVELPIPILRAIYKLIFDLQGQSETTVIDLRLNIFGSDIQGWYVPRKKKDTDALEQILHVFRIIKDRVNEIGCGCSFQAVDISIPSLATIRDQIVSSGNRRLAELIAGGHANAVLQSYTSKKMSPAIDRNAETAFIMNEYLSPVSLNNLGYYYVSEGVFDRAETLLKMSVATGQKAGEFAALASFNLAMLYARRGDYTAAQQLLRSISGFDDDVPVCLFVPKINADGLDFAEVKGNLNLEQEIANALQGLSTLK